MYRLLAIAFVAILAMGALAIAFAPGGEEAAPNAGPSEASIELAAPAPSAGLVLQRDASGQFHLSATVNDEEAQFLVDTGADMVALTLDEAERLGVEVDPAEFAPILQTAAGEGMGARVTIDSLTIAGREFANVPAIVAEGLPVNLLGQSVLKRFGKVELSGDRMVISRD